MTHAVCPGSFDPPTLGHLDVIGRAAGLFDRVTVAVLVNPDKRACSPSTSGSTCCARPPSSGPTSTSTRSAGCWSTTARTTGIAAIVKGLRAVSDFDYELQMAQMNHGLTGVDTLFMPTSPAYSFVSSSLVKQVATYGGDVAHLLPDVVAAALAAKPRPAVTRRRQTAQRRAGPPS